MHAARSSIFFLVFFLPSVLLLFSHSLSPLLARSLSSLFTHRKSRAVMPPTRLLPTSLILISIVAVLLMSSTHLPKGQSLRETAEREATEGRRSTTSTTNDDAPPSPSLFLPLALLSTSSSSSSPSRGSTLRRHADHRSYSPLWLHARNFYALDERGSFSPEEEGEDDASVHVAGAATRVEALPTGNAAELVAGSLSSSLPSSSAWLGSAPALLLEVPWPALSGSTAVWMEVVAGAAAAVREAIEVEREEEEEKRKKKRRRPFLFFFLDLLLLRRPSSSSSSSSAPTPPPPPPPRLFDFSSSAHRMPLPLVILLPNTDSETWASTPAARWAREEALPLALEAAAEVALRGAGEERGEEGEQQQRRQLPFFSLHFLTKDDLESSSRTSWVGFEAVIVPHGRSTTPRRDAGFGFGGSKKREKSKTEEEEPNALAVAFRRRAWQAAGLPLDALSASASAAMQVERGCDPRGDGNENGGARGARDLVLVSEPSSSLSPSSSSSPNSNNNDNNNNNAIANFEELSAALERVALSLGLGARPALLTPSTTLASAARTAARSKVVIGKTGPALAALVPLLAPGTGVVELVPPNWEWEGSHLLIRNLTRGLFGRGAGEGRGGGKGVLYSSWRPGELPSCPSPFRALLYASPLDERRFGRWSASECAADRECSEATARGFLRVDVSAVVDEVALLAGALLSCENNDFDDSASERQGGG